jgi:glycogen(starch) synthase
MEAKADYFFELSWEVCNKVGGIYTVITSKIVPMLKFYRQNYFVVGPYFPGKIKNDELKEKLPPEFLKDIFEKLHTIGIKCHFGTWTIDGEPNTILIDYSDFRYKLNDIKTNNWLNFKIDSINTEFHDYDEPILWSTCTGILLEEIKNTLKEKKIVAQFHEWLAGGGLLYLKSKNIKIGTVFTTHATMLGRTMATAHLDVYGLLDKINPDEKAKEFGIQAKHFTEKACAHNSDAFTTVSEITGIEATHFYGKKPDLLLPNGLDIQRFPTFDESSIKHKQLKTKLKKFLVAYFFPYYQFDLEDTLFFFFAGRYEFHDKGIDIFIKALSKLNDELKKNHPEKTIVALIWVPAGVKDIKPEILENKNYYEDIKESIQDILEDLKDKIIYSVVSEKDINQESLLGKSLLLEIERKVARFKKQGTPSLSTHNLFNEQNDEILRCLKANNLNNTKEDRVKAIFYPIYLTGADQLVDLNYYESILACHLGVFPSYYEPWGYTPMETGALGIAAVTTDLAGFGRYIQKITDKSKNQGIFVLDRLNKSEESVIYDLLKVFLDFAVSTKQDRIENKMRAKRLADTADWALLADNYIKAHNIAIDRNG